MTRAGVKAKGERCFAPCLDVSAILAYFAGKERELIMATQQTKTERVQVRIDPVAKHMLERAAALANTTVSGFVVNNALEAADRLIGKRERLAISQRDWNRFFDALVDPPEPNAALRRAFAAHGRLMTKTVGG